MAVVVAIYSTLGLAQRLAGALDDDGAAILFVLCMLLVGATAVALGLGLRPGGAEIGVAFGVAVAYTMVFTRMAIVTERSHLIEYGVVALFIHEALKERATQGRRVPTPGLLAILAASLVGVVDELIQELVPGRVLDPVDMLFNFLAAVMAVGASVALGWARRFTSRRRGP